MKTIHVSEISEALRRMCVEACTVLEDDVIIALESALMNEESSIGREVLEKILENARIAAEENIPLCQDTGMAVVFAEIGQDVHLTGGNLHDAINHGVRQGYSEGNLRKSVLHPVTRVNTGDNTPAVIHTELVSGECLKLTLAPKGFGSENMSRVMMFPPSAGIEGVKNFVIQRVEESGGNPCPPIIVGVGLGGTFEKCAFLAKKALIRKLGLKNPDPVIAELESELLTRINLLGLGPMGFGGRITALAVHVEWFPTHIAGLPVAVNIQCHSSRHKEVVL